MRLTGKTALVTGGSAGLGEATVRHLAANGCRVVVFDIDREAGSALAAQLGEQVLFLPVDVSDARAVADGVDQAIRAFGAIHIVVCCAAIERLQKLYSRSRGLFDLNAYRELVRVNLDGTFYVVRETAARMADNEAGEDGERGVIIMTSSCAGHQAKAGQVVYAATKGAILSMTLPLARELGRYGIRVMSISPGTFDTLMFRRGVGKWMESVRGEIPFPKRFGDPPEYARAVEAIVTNPYLNGADYRLDAGYRQSY